MNLLHKEITDKIIKTFYKVYNELRFGFLEKGYKNALFIELELIGLICEKQKPITVFYEEHELQLINYLKATEIEVGLLLNFGKTLAFKRKVFSNERKKININKPV